MKKGEKQEKPGSVKIIMTAIMVIVLSVIMASCANKSNKASSPPPPPPPAASSSMNETVYDSVDVMPEYPGGKEALIKYISNKIKYPEEAKKNKIEGTVLVSFVVEKDGSVDKAKVLQGVDSLLDSEALRVINALPKFERAGIKDGENVAVSYMLPIKFKLDGKE